MGNALGILADYDVVIDGTDNFPTRYLVGDACALLGLPHVWGSVSRFDGQASVWWAGDGPCYRCVFPSPPPPGTVPSCAEGGVLGVLCGSIGSVQVAETLKLLLGIGDPLVGRLLVHDALRMTWDTVPGPARPRLPALRGRPEHPHAHRRRGRVPTRRPRPRRAGGGGRRGPHRLGRRARRAARLPGAGEDDFVLVDVRRPEERDVVAIPGAEAVPVEAFRAGDALDALPADRPVILHCRSGARSLEAARLLRRAGRRDVSHLEGGVLAWVRDVDPSLPSS